MHAAAGHYGLVPLVDLLEQPSIDFCAGCCDRFIDFMRSERENTEIRLTGQHVCGRA
jgi:hypothetical protein